MIPRVIIAFSEALIIGLPSLAIAKPVWWKNHHKPPAFFLAGDSTTAPQNADGGGWGDGFLNWTLTGRASGINFGVDGSTTESFVAAGYWEKVLDAVRESKHQFQPYVTIQFGHNDQKPTANISLSQFTSNLENLASQAAEAGAIPIILTSITRRNFNTSTSPEIIIKDLLDVVVGAKNAAENGHFHSLELNQASMDYCNSIGPFPANTFDLDYVDHTHLNDHGTIVFGGIVAEMLLWEFPGLHEYVSVDPGLSLAIKEGTYWWPVVVDGILTAGSNSSAPLVFDM